MRAKFVNNQLWIDKPFLKELLSKHHYRIDEKDTYQIKFDSMFASYLIVDQMNKDFYRVVPTTSRNNERPALQLETYWELCKDRDVIYEGEIPKFYYQWFRNRGLIKEGVIKEENIKVRVDRATVNLPGDRKALQQFGKIWKKIYGALKTSPDKVGKYKLLVKKLRDSKTTGAIDKLAGVYSFMGNLFHVEVDENKLRKNAPTPWVIMFAGDESHLPMNAGVEKMDKLRQIIREEIKSVLRESPSKWRPLVGKVSAACEWEYGDCQDFIKALLIDCNFHDEAEKVYKFMDKL